MGLFTRASLETTVYFTIDFDKSISQKEVLPMAYFGDIAFISILNDDIIQRIKDKENLIHPALKLNEKLVGITITHLKITVDKKTEFTLNSSSVSITEIREFSDSISSIRCTTAGTSVRIEYEYGDSPRKEVPVYAEVERADERIIEIAFDPTAEISVPYPDGTWNKNNTMITSMVGLLTNGNRKHIVLNVTLTDYGLYGYFSTIDEYNGVRILLRKY